MQIKTFDQLYSIDKNNRIVIWNIKVVQSQDQKSAEIITAHGIIDGKQVVHTVTVNKGKNIGKKNETTPFTQAVADAQSKWQKKLDKGCTTTLPTADANTASAPATLFPMLAQEYKKNAHKVSFPAFIQPKLDGYRMIWNPQTKKATTRTGKEYTNTSTTLFDELRNLNLSIPLDGELYVHDPQFKFEQFGVLRKTKALSPSDHQALQKIEYHVYDVIDTSLPFYSRTKFLNSLKLHNCTKIKIVPTFIVNNVSELENLHQSFVNTGYEGSIIRTSNGLYKCKFRSYDLLKKKDFDDSEFKIVGFTFEKDTSGNNEPLVVWTCKSDSGIEFNVRPKGTEQERKDLFKKASEYIGKKLWVKFFGLTEAGVPRFPTTAHDSVQSYIRNETC